MLLWLPVHSCAQEKSFTQLADLVFISVDFEEINDIKRRFKENKLSCGMCVLPIQVVHQRGTLHYLEVN
jgi:hypothetical protein